MRELFIRTLLCRAASAISVICLLCFGGVASAQTATPDPVRAIALQAAGNADSNLEKTVRMVDWLHHNLEWSATDYQKRTVGQILERRAGNCADLARVLKAMLAEVGVPFRWAAEINIQPISEEREKNSTDLIKAKGKRYSLFGRHHNDHRWLEIYDDRAKAWVPADAAVGVVGTRAWIAARLAFENRTQSDIPVIAEIVREMIVPVVVLALSPTEDSVIEQRSQHYLIDEFNRYYGGKLETLPSWNRWKALTAELASPAIEAFAGRYDLHQRKTAIDELAQVYESLRKEAAQLKVQPAT